jgi:hypothetical protein
LENSIFDGAPNGTDSGAAIYGGTPVVIDSVARNMSNGLLSIAAGSPRASIISGNHIHNINNSFDPDQHENAIEPIGFGTNYIFNNLIHDTTAVTILTQGGASSGVPEIDYLWNNIIYNSPPLPVQFDTVSTSQGSSAAYAYNNTIVATGGNSCFRLANRGNGNMGTLDLRNNLCLTTGGSFLSIDSGITANTLTNSSNLTLTHAVAQTQGYTVANRYRPTASTNSTVDAGASLASLCTGQLASLCTGVNLTTPPNAGLARPTGNAWVLGICNNTSSVRHSLVCRQCSRDIGRWSFVGNSIQEFLQHQLVPGSAGSYYIYIGWRHFEDLYGKMVRGCERDSVKPHHYHRGCNQLRPQRHGHL